MLHRARKIAAQVSVVAATAALIGATATPAQAAPGCYGNGRPGIVPSCTGMDPQAAGCSADAVTLEQVGALAGDPPKTIWVELRYSKACYAAWTRHSSQYGGAGDVSIEGNITTYSKKLSAYPGEQGWTRMISFSQTVRSCVLHWYAAEQRWFKPCSKYY